MTPFWTAFLDGLALRPMWKFLAKPDIDSAITREREACAVECEKYAERELAAEMDRINEDDWSFCDPIDYDSDDSLLNDEHPKVLAETTAKATAWMMYQCAARIRARTTTEKDNGT